MTRKCFFMGIVLLTLFLAGCATAATSYDVVAVTNNPIGSKVGEVRAKDGGVYQAAKNGGITKISTVEIRTPKNARPGESFIVVTGE
jgi:hypothetical protein